MQIKVDHASVCGSNLSTLQDAFASVGLAADFGGPHAHGGTQMALLGFDDGSYLELIAPQKAGAPIDFYNPDVKPTKELDLGTFELKAGGNEFSATIIGANEKAIKSYMLGLDYLLLKPAE